MAFCGNCGTKLENEEKYCHKCGANVSINEKSKKGNNRNIPPNMIIILIVLFLIVIGMCLPERTTKKETSYAEDPDTVEVTDSVEAPLEDILSEEESLDFENGVKYDSDQNDSYTETASSEYMQESSYREFLTQQSVIGYLANQRFYHSSGVNISIDGDGRIYIDGDFAGILSVLRYDSKNALLRYGNGMYGEGKILVRIVGNKFELVDPLDGTVWFQK